MTMRIDYSVPKISRSSSHTSQTRTRNVSLGWVVIVVIITALTSLGIGFGSGLMFSRHSAQTPRQQAAIPLSPVVAAQKQTTATGTSQPAGDPPLEFYTRLKYGQKQAPLGSGINSDENKSANQPPPAVPVTRTDANGSSK